MNMWEVNNVSKVTSSKAPEAKIYLRFLAPDHMPTHTLTITPNPKDQQNVLLKKEYLKVHCVDILTRGKFKLTYIYINPNMIPLMPIFLCQ